MSELTKIIDDLKVAISWSGNQHGLIDLNLLLKRLEKLNVEPQINDNQQIVLEWLKKQYHEPADCQFPLFILKDAITEMPRNVFAFYDDLNEKEEFELLIGFAEWGLEQEEKHD